MFQDVPVINKEDTTINLFSYEKDLAEYEDNPMEITNESDQIVIQDLTKINYLFNKAGCGIPHDEAYLIGLTMSQMTNQDKFKNIR